MLVTLDFEYREFSPEQRETLEKVAINKITWHKAWGKDETAMSPDAPVVLDSNDAMFYMPVKIVKMHEHKDVDTILQKIEPVLNAKCNVVVPGPGLTEIKYTCLLEDSCTDVLQEHLKRGWKILAICVQPNQRRPDYILGSEVLLDL